MGRTVRQRFASAGPRFAGHLRANVVGYVALFVALVGSAYAATSFVGSNGTIRACASSTVKLVLVKPGQHCKRGQKAVRWSQRRQEGLRGAQGLQGATGPTDGPAGGDLTGN